MQPPHQHPRIDLADLKDQLVKKLGRDKSRQYFEYLRRFLSMKVSKVEFNKLCLGILGRENISLHNQLIRSILKNASTAKSPPPVNRKDEASADIYYENGSHGNTARSSSPVGKVKLARQLTENKSSASNVVLENGNIDLPEIDRLVQHHHQEIARPALMNDEAFVSNPSKMIALRNQESALGPSQVSRLEVFSNGSLLDSFTLRERMERIALGHGLEGLSLDCANLLNLGLDSYLKGLIRSSIELQQRDKLTYGLRPGDQIQTQGNNHSKPISLQDFRVAIERDPWQLGHGWPSLLEKISTRSSEE